MPFEGDYTQADYAQQLIDEYKAAGVIPTGVFAQSFDLNDVLYWIENEPEFGGQAVYLDDRYDDGASITPIRRRGRRPWRSSRPKGIKIIAPPMWMLVDAERRTRRSSPRDTRRPPRPRASTSSPGRSSAPARSTRAAAGTIGRSARRSTTTATCSCCSTCSPGRSASAASSPTGRRP